jgi:hypothetical protein
MMCKKTAIKTAITNATKAIVPDKGVNVHISGAGVISVNSSDLIKSEEARKQIDALERMKKKKLL